MAALTLLTPVDNEPLSISPTPGVENGEATGGYPGHRPGPMAITLSCLSTAID